MKTNTLNSATLTNSGAFTAGAIGGSMISRVAVEKIPLQNTKLKKGILLALGVLGAAFVDNKETSGKFLQGMAVGTAATQGVELLKEFVTPKEDGILKTALGAPEPIVIYADDYDTSGYYMDYEDVSLEPSAFEGQQFLAAGQENFATV